ncbi:hydroxyacid dehydrogenase [Streptomyces sp. NPDC056637]|uniref:hydroxyacid dehydrogenase n=1 Tax=unclassified Streptomyces TaxID=2593676 RepID=UPI003674F045
MSAETKEAILDEAALRRLTDTAAIDVDLLLTDFAATSPELETALASAEVLFTGWGCPPLTSDALKRMPELRAVIHAAGSVKHHMTEAAWARGLVATSAAQANGLPVAEYTLAAILFANKRVLQGACVYREARTRPNLLTLFPGIGNYRRTVGIVGASTIGRRVLELLRPFDLTVLLHDPYVGHTEARAMGAEAVDLNTLVRRSDVVSIHAPELPETYHQFDRGRLALLRDGATLINTARGPLVDTQALTDELVSGRIHAVLDVTDPEPLPADSPLFDLPNVLLTPHIAGSLGNELARMADTAIDELERYAHGQRFEHPVHPAALARSA